MERWVEFAGPQPAETAEHRGLLPLTLQRHHATAQGWRLSDLKQKPPAAPSTASVAYDGGWCSPDRVVINITVAARA